MILLLIIISVVLENVKEKLYCVMSLEYFNLMF